MKIMEISKLYKRDRYNCYWGSFSSVRLNKYRSLEYMYTVMTSVDPHPLCSTQVQGCVLIGILVCILFVHVLLHIQR